MTRLILAAGVAALAIVSAAEAKPGGGGGGGNPHGDEKGGPPAAKGDGGRQDKGGGEARGGGGHGHGGGSAAPQMRVERQQVRGEQTQRVERQQFRGPQIQRVERQQARQQSRGFERQQARQQSRGFERKQARQQAGGFERQQARQQSRGLERQQARQQSRGFERRQVQNTLREQRGSERQQARNFERQQIGGNGQQQLRQQAFANQQFNTEAFRGHGKLKLNGQDVRFAAPQVAQQDWNSSRVAALNYGNNYAIRPVTQVEQFIGVPVAQVANFAALSPLPTTVQYLYPDTPDYYYRYGDGYLYQVNRGTNLIDMLLPLLGGGYMPGQYLPQPYMASYVPDYYGMNSFYPDYGDTCNRYANGMIYEVDCATGYVEDVIPMYASGYGVGQMLPSSYSYYNVPMQYRSMYYDTPDYGYWYAPGAIYQYDQRSSMITSVAALMAPGFTVGQPLPVGYDVYNVPYDYRATYYDTASASYRYNNGYIYQVDPVTQIVTALVASLLT